MTSIGLLSDTHSFLDDQIFKYFENCDEIWHAGDIGNPQIVSKLESFKPLRAVYGNIDGSPIRKAFPLNNRFKLEGLDIWITHIGGYPGKYSPLIRDQIKQKPPDLFICGHSHILKVMRDKSLSNLLHLNPGACGKEGFHKIRTILRFKLNEGQVSDLEAIELGKR